MRDWSDEKLQMAAADALREAHEAPMNPYRLDADGHRWVELNKGWAIQSKLWCEIMDEIDRRKQNTGLRP